MPIPRVATLVLRFGHHGAEVLVLGLEVVNVMLEHLHALGGTKDDLFRNFG